MSRNDKTTKSVHKRKLTTLISLVLFVFVILFVSTLISGTISYLLMAIGVLPLLLANRFPVMLVFMLFTSLFTGTVIAIIAGDFFLRPLRRLTEATKEVSAGNFDISVEVGGPLEINRLAVSFNEMTKELQCIETLRNDFVSNISHEFKTPVVSIRGFARRLKKNNLTDGQRSEYLDIIITETERLTNLSSNVLLLSNLENTDRVPDKATYSLDEQLRRCILLLEPQFQKKQLEIDVNLESMLFIGSEEIIQHLWINLLSNAIKFNSDGGRVGVSLGTDKGKAVVSISDTGCGMNEEVKKHIYDKFYQEDRSRSTEGNGLGLSLVKRILEICDGEMSIESTVGIGTSFTVSLPMN